MSNNGVEGRLGSPRQIKITNIAVRQAAHAYYEALGGIDATNQVEGVEVKHDIGSETKGLRLYLSRSEVSLAPRRMRDVLADLGIDGRESIFVAVHLSERQDQESQINNFRLILRPREVTETKFGIDLGLWDTEVLTPNRMPKELNPWYLEVAQTYRELWQPLKPASRLSHHPAKAEILGAGHEWIGQVVARRIQLVESGLVRPAEITK